MSLYMYLTPLWILEGFNTCVNVSLQHTKYILKQNINETMPSRKAINKRLFLFVTHMGREP